MTFADALIPRKAFRLPSVLAVSAAIIAIGCVAPTGASAKTLGFIFTSWDTAVYQTRFWDECPDGAAIGTDEYWWKGTSKEERARLSDNGNLETFARVQKGTSHQRGPNKEDVCWNPTIVKDPPIREVQGKISFGMNLDGDANGRSTAATCAHEEFVSPTGEAGIDNQLYRMVGCEIGWRDSGLVDRFANEERKTGGRALILIEVTDVDDPINDPDVKVAFYKSADFFPFDVAGNVLPGNSYRIDSDGGVPRYGDVARGSIVNGVLKTEPADVRMPYYGIKAYAEIALRRMRLNLQIAPDGRTANGIVAGYYDIEHWWHYFLNASHYAGTNDYNCPDMWEAIHRLADGYPDPVTGKCTAISSAFKIQAVSAFAIHPKPAGEKKVSSAPQIFQAERTQ